MATVIGIVDGVGGLGSAIGQLAVPISNNDLTMC